MNFYNDNDPKICAWLRELIASKLIPEGDVYEKDFRLLEPDALGAYTQHHFFCGIGGWPHALALAGWTGPCWTASLPCQPFSCAGQQRGESDERHLWPDFRKLVEIRKPPVIFGEQVASAAGREWLAGVRADLEALGYEVGAADLCAACVGAPHIRQRIYWVADLQLPGLQGGAPWHAGQVGHGTPTARHAGQGFGNAGRLADADNDGSCQPLRVETVENSNGEDGRIHNRNPGAWEIFNTIRCADGGTRRFESRSFPLAHGFPARVGLLRGYGNAIVPQVAAEFVRAFRECSPQLSR